MVELGIESPDQCLCKIPSRIGVKYFTPILESADYPKGWLFRAFGESARLIKKHIDME
jgi:hypothetical protein